MPPIAAAPVRSWPSSLEFDPATDPARGRHLVLGAPWGARVHPLHESGADRISRDDFVVDRALLASGLSVTVNHDPRRKVGKIVDAATDDTGLWLVVDLTSEGEEVLAADGRVSIDVIQPKFRWILSGVAVLTADQSAGIEGAKAIFTAGGDQQFWVEPVEPRPDLAAFYAGTTTEFLRGLVREADIQGGRVTLNPVRAPESPPPTAVAMDIGAHKAEMYSVSMAAVEDDVRRDRARFERNRLQHAAMRAEDWQTPLVASMTPHSQWPRGSRERDGWEQLKARQAAERAAREAQVHRAALDELQTSLRAREDVVVEEVKPSWLSRMLSRLSGRC